MENKPDRINEFNKDYCDEQFCSEGLYYCNLYECNPPCIHYILNKRWANLDYNTLNEFGIKDLLIDNIDRTKVIIEFIDDKFKKKCRRE